MGKLAARMYEPGDINHFPKADVAGFFCHGQVYNPAITFFEDGEPIGCMGALQDYDNAEAWIWAVFNPGVNRHGFRITRETQRAIETMAQEYDLERVKALVDPSKPGNVRWIRTLGFDYTGKIHGAWAEFERRT